MRSMMLTLFFVLTASGAQAHVGHLADVAGHDHWVIGAALGAIALAGLLGALKGKETDVEDNEDEGEPA